jgi:nucleotide-binding universal stress UspA family protein
MYKTILVHANDTRRFPELISAATELARIHASHLIGLSAMPQIRFTAYDAGLAAPTIFEEESAVYKKAEARLNAQFEVATAQAATGGFTAEWRNVGSGFEPASDVVVAHGRTADLIIASQADADWYDSPRYDAPDVLAVESGRPVLIVPNKGNKSLVAKRIVVGWNGRREAARAVFDALPLLKAAEEVSVLWVNPEAEHELAGDFPAIDICAALARHGVKCEEAQPVSPQGTVGETLLFEATKFGSDLLVMGCYGHSRFREFVLGGASRHVLKNTTVPVLMSH